MTNTATLLDEPSGFRTLYAPVAALLALALVILLFAGLGPGGRACAVDTAAAPAPATAPARAEAAKPVAPAGAMPGLEKLYFGSGSAALAAAAQPRLAAVAGWLKAHPVAKVVLSGFHDPSGNLARNEALALERARAVRAALGDLGIAKERVEMAKPQQTALGGSPAEARRVELSIKP